MITPDQIRAARALKNWSQSELANRTGLTAPTIANIELGKQKPSAQTIQRIALAFETANIEFLEGEGVRKSTGYVATYNGREGFAQFFDDIDETAQNIDNGEFLVSNVNERDFVQWENQDLINRHTKIIDNSNIKYRILTLQGDDYFPAKSYAEYRWVPKEQFYSVPFYVYGTKVAIIGFEENDVNVFVIKHPYIAQLCRRQFNEMWEHAVLINS